MLSPGRRLGPYEITVPIGAGGMGEVYKARDIRLDRTVAIKVMTAEVASADGLGRFQVEARAIAALAHPNICALYDVGHEGPVHYFVMEYLEGETLADRLKSGPLPLDQALNRAVEIADALDKAHAHGITHRDLKPANVFLAKTRRSSGSSGSVIRSSDGAIAKLLDFGLAKLRPPEAVLDEVNRLETRPPQTGAGVIIGTLNYMSPEQANGDPVDARSDLFSFGALFYEMLTGRRAFDGRSSSAVLAAILEREPEPPSAIVAGLPPGVDFAINRCLAKSPDDRWQSARDLRAQLLHTINATNTPAAAKPANGPWPTWAIVGLGLVAVLTLGTLLLRAPASARRPLWLSVLPPPHGFGPTPTPALSPDGHQLAFTAPDDTGQTVLWIRAIDELVPRALPGTEGASEPFWAPDSRAIGIFAQGKLKTVDPSGGLPHVIADAPNPRGGAWSANGEIVYVPNPSAGLYRIRSTGGAPEAIPTATSEGALTQGYPWFLPDGEHLVFFTMNNDASKSGLYLLDMAGFETQLISNALSRAEYVPGHLVFGRDGSLFAQAFDPATGVLSGEPIRLVDDVGRSGGASRFNYAFSVAADGTLAYWSATTMPVTQLTWFDRSGRRVRTVGPPEVFHGFDLSPDGTRAAVERMDPRTTLTDIRIVDLERPSGAATTIISPPEGHVVNSPLWSPDGKSILYTDTSVEVLVRELASGQSRMIPTEAGGKWPTSWSNDGRYVAMDRTTTVGEVWVLPMTGDGKAEPYLTAAHSLQGAQISPDGRWVAYRSDETGEFEIYVDSFPKPGRKVRVSVGGGSRPRWRHDGRELYFIGRQQRVMAAGVEISGAGVRVTDPKALFDGPRLNLWFSRSQYVASPDGQSFLFNAEVDDGSVLGISVGVGVVPVS